jgi:hypothetical protein
MLPSNKLGHLHTPEDFESCVSSVKRHLQPGEAFVIGVFVPLSTLNISLAVFGAPPRQWRAIIGGITLLRRAP